MVCHTGPPGRALPLPLPLLLLCCMGTLLPVRTASILGSDWERIITELKASLDKLLESYKSEMYLSNYPLQDFSSACQPPHINSTALLRYFRAIQPLLNDTRDLEDIIQQLHKVRLPRGTEAPVPVPTDSFHSKRFMLTVLQEFSTCLQAF